MGELGAKWKAPGGPGSGKQLDADPAAPREVLTELANPKEAVVAAAAESLTVDLHA